MQTASDTLKSQWDAYDARREHWVAKSRFYHDYVTGLVHFLVPGSARTHVVRRPFDAFPAKESFEYVVICDKLGYVDDVQAFLEQARHALISDGRLVITQYNSLWEPVLRVASFLGLRSPSVEQNWLSPHDLRVFLELAGFEVVKKGSKMLLPIHIPIVSWFFNTFVANVWPFSHLGLIHYVVARPVPHTNEVHTPSLSIVVPARNEAGTIERIAREIPTLGVYTEVIFIEGHSRDNTLAEIERVVKTYKGTNRLSCAVQTGKGKGDAVRKGFAMATGDILAIYDADMTVPPEDMRKFYDALVTHRTDFANGSRLVYPVEKGAMRLLNMAANKFFGLAFSAILGQPLKDTLCGTKVVWRKDYDAIAKNRSFFGDFDPFGDFDLLFGAAKLNLKIIDIPVRYRDRVYGATNINRWRHGWLLLKMTVFSARKLVFF